jgi:hypothetical protein
MYRGREEGPMSDGKEERKEQEERRKWEEERKSPRRDGDVREPDWERDGRPERRDSRAPMQRRGRSLRGGLVEAFWWPLQRLPEGTSIGGSIEAPVTS